jgi:hypothetical protein
MIHPGIMATNEMRSAPDRREYGDDNGDVKFRTTHDGNVVIMQPGERNDSVKLDDDRGHGRNLSELFDATTLTDVHTDESDDRKHRRIFSGDISNPNVAHRRLDLTGASRPVRRRHHSRGDSVGLDILSAAVNASQDELAVAAGHPLNKFGDRPSLGQVSMSSFESGLPTEQHSRAMHLLSQGQGNVSFGSQVGNYQLRNGQIYPVSETEQGPGRHTTYEGRWGGAFSAITQTQSAQHMVTGLAVGDGTRTMEPNARGGAHHRQMSSFSNTLNNILGTSIFAPPDGLDKNNGHHRKLSSTMSFLQGLTDASFGATEDDAFLRNLQESNILIGDYRSSSQPEAHSLQTPSHLTQMMAEPMRPPSVCSSNGSAVSNNAATQNSTLNGSESRLASGGASKRVRRKCTVTGCENRVVQGGLCIAHGAKRKSCKHPGCDKNVKKAGLCSTHGPSRKRCENPGCEKVAVQGGKCIAHGAKKRLCGVEHCMKQAILNGMCKRHHDQYGDSNVGANSNYCEDVLKPTIAVGHKPTHTRGLSIFQEMSAAAVQSLLNEKGKPY